MSWHRLTIDFCVDDELLAAHPGDDKPPPNDIVEWDAADVFRAADEGIIDDRESVIQDYFGTVSEPTT